MAPNVQSAPVFGLPPGVVVAYSGATAPPGWLLCYGQAVSRTTYAALFALYNAMGLTIWGVGDGSTTFNVPDMRDTVPVGKADMGGANRNLIAGSDAHSIAATTLGALGGEELHTPTAAEVKDHSHSHSHTSTSGGFRQSSGSTTMGSGGGLASLASVITDTDASGASGASSAPHNNMQPSTILNYIVATGGP